MNFWKNKDSSKPSAIPPTQMRRVGGAGLAPSVALGASMQLPSVLPAVDQAGAKGHVNHASHATHASRNSHQHVEHTAKKPDLHLIVAEQPTEQEKVSDVQTIDSKPVDVKAVVTFSDILAFTKLRAPLVDAVPTSLRDQVLVFDCGFAKAVVIALEGATSKGVYSSIRSNLTGFTIQREFVVDAEGFANAQEFLKSIPRAAVVNADDRGRQIFEDLVRGAYALGASDLHFRLRDDGKSDVRLRLFGRMRPWQDFSTDVLLNATRAAYSGATKRGTNSRSDFTLETESSTMTEHIFNGKVVMGRLAHRPVLGGGKTVIRLLETSNDPKSLRIKSFSDLGYADSHIENQIMPSLRRNSGLFLMAGSTGSGKSTTLRSAMFYIPGREVLEMYSVEDPTEYVMPWVNQLSIQSASDDTDEIRKGKFLSSLRSMMRMDPDVGMIGEIRDTESARIATELTQTGHRVLSTVHGEGTVDVLSRMTGDLLQVPADILGTKKYLTAVIYQKLLPLLCAHCKIPAPRLLSKEKQHVLTSKFFVDVGTMYTANVEGCDKCRLNGVSTEGTKGQTVVAEILTPDDAMRIRMKEKNWPELERIWRSARATPFTHVDMSGKTAYEHALYKATQGLIDPNDIEADFEPFETYQIFGDVAVHQLQGARA